MDEDRWMPDSSKYDILVYQNAYNKELPEYNDEPEKDAEPEREEPSFDKIQGYLDGYQAAIDVAKSISSSVVVDQDIIVYILERNLKNMTDAEASK